MTVDKRETANNWKKIISKERLRDNPESIQAMEQKHSKIET